MNSAGHAACSDAGVAMLTRFRTSSAVVRTRGRAHRASRAGAVSVEYLMVTAIVGLSLALALVALGPDMVMSWAYSRHVLYGRSP